MKKLALACILLFIGCVGSPEPRNPMRLDGVAAVDTTIWWRQPYYGEKDSPWNKFIPEQPKWHDPWSTFDEDEYGIDVKPRDSSIIPFTFKDDG